MSVVTVSSGALSPTGGGNTRRQLRQRAAGQRAAQQPQQLAPRHHQRPHRPSYTTAADWRQCQWRQAAATGAAADDGSLGAGVSLDAGHPGSLPDNGVPSSSSSSAEGHWLGDQHAAAAPQQGNRQREGSAAPAAAGPEAGQDAQPLGDEQQQQQQQQQQQAGQQQQAQGPWRLQWQLPDVPWALNTTITLMVLWLLCFWAAAYTLVPNLLRWAGVEAAGGAATAEAAAWVQVVRHLVLDGLQVGTTVLLLRRGLAPYSPRQLGLFAAPLRPLRHWLLAVAAGVLTFPVIDWLYKRMVAVLAAAEEQAVSSTADQILGTSSWATQALWFGVLAVCAPVWEELMFRGFLLPSLARYLPHWAAIAATSLIFALVHFSRDGLLPLLLLGCVFGASYAYTRNLLAPIVLHSLWNVGLLVQLLAGSGAV